MKSVKNIVLWIFIIGFAGYIISNKEKPQTIENLDVSIGLGYSLRGEGASKQFVVPINVISYKENKNNESIVRTGIAESMGETRDDRQRRTSKKFFLGTERIYMPDEGFARNGIRPMLDILFTNPKLNDNGYFLICKGKVEDYFNYNIEGYDAPVQYIQGMIRNSTNYNFFAKNQSLRDAYLTVDAEGKNLVAPYIELKEDGFQITGLAIFKKDKLVSVIGMDKGKILNLLREKKSKGIVSIKKSDKEYVSVECKVKRKTKCYKEEDKYRFLITLDIKADIINNELYNKISSDIKEEKKFKSDMENRIEEMSKDFIKDMQNNYQIDMLNLGSIAAGKYGRGTEVDWNDIVSNSKIDVKAKVKLDKIGRGQY